MKIYIGKKDLDENLYGFLRRCKYAPFYDSYVRLLSRTGYPRFHLHIKETGSEYIFNLHLDQKKPSYENQTAHSGEYDGEVVEAEAERIMVIGKIAKSAAEP